MQNFERNQNTPSLNFINESFENELQNMEYWTLINPTKFVEVPKQDQQTKDIINKYSQLSEASFTQQQQTPKQQKQTLKLDERLYPKKSPARKINQQNYKETDSYKAISNHQSSFIEDYQSLDWQDLIQKAEKQIGCQTKLQGNDSTIRLLLEQLINQNQQQQNEIKKLRHELLQVKEQNETLINNQKKIQYNQETVKQQLTMPQEYSEAQKELYVKLMSQSKAQLSDIIIKCTKQLPATPRRIEEIQTQIKSMIVNNPECLELKNKMFNGYKMIQQVIASLSTAMDERFDLETYSVCNNKFIQNYNYEMQKISNCLDNVVSAFAELMRFRQKISGMLGIQSEKVYIPIYSLIKQNAKIAERLQMEMTAGKFGENKQFQDLNIFLDEFIEKSVTLQQDSLTQSTFDFLDTTLASSGQKRQDIINQQLTETIKVEPKVLVRLTNQEAFQAIQYLLFITNYFQKLFNIRRSEDMISRIATLYHYVGESQNLLNIIKKYLGLQQTATANQIVQSIQLLRDRILQYANQEKLSDEKQQQNKNQINRQNKESTNEQSEETSEQ